MKITIGSIITFSICFIFVSIVMTGIIYSFASSVCIEEKTVPFRYVGVDGAFSSIDKLETTEVMRDGYMEKCIKHHKAKFFAFQDNLEYIVTPTSEIKLLNQKE